MSEDHRHSAEISGDSEPDKAAAEPKEPSPEALAIARRLRFFLSTTGTKQSHLCRRLGKAPATVHGWVHRGEIGVTNLMKVIEALGVTPAYFWGVEVPPDEDAAA
jgi:hypothetical protein